MENRKVYKITTTTPQGNRGPFTTLTDAKMMLAELMGWETIVLGDSYHIGMREGARGSVYAHSAYETQEECDADSEGAHAPRILIVTGDEAWAMGKDVD